MIAALAAGSLAACPTAVPKLSADAGVDALLGAKVEEVCVLGTDADLGKRRGKPLALEAVREDIEALMAGETVRDVQVIAVPAAGGAKKTVTLVYACTEYDRLDALEATGNHELSTEDIARGVDVGKPLSALRPRQLATAVERIYAERGYLGASVDYAVAPTAPGHVKLSLTVHEGVRQIVSELRFPGAKVIKEAELRRAVHSKVGDPFSQEVVDRDALALSAVLFDHGMVTGSVEAPETRELPKRPPGSVALVFAIKEGPVFKVRKVTMKDWAWGDEADVLKALETRAGQPFARSSVASDLDRLRFRARQKGAEIEIAPSTHLDLDAHVVDLTFEITKKPSTSVEF